MTCQSAALVLSRCRDDNDANYSALCSIHLPEGDLVQLPAPKPVADTSKLRVDISRLLTASSDGLVVYVVMAYTPVFVPGSAAAVLGVQGARKMSAQTGEHRGDRGTPGPLRIAGGVGAQELPNGIAVVSRSPTTCRG